MADSNITNFSEAVLKQKLNGVEDAVKNLVEKLEGNTGVFQANGFIVTVEEIE